MNSEINNVKIKARTLLLQNRHFRWMRWTGGEEKDSRVWQRWHSSKYDAAGVLFFPPFLCPNAIFYFLLIACLQSRECDDARHSDGGQK